MRINPHKVVWPPGPHAGRPGSKELPAPTCEQERLDIHSWSLGGPEQLLKNGLGWRYPVQSPLETSASAGAGRDRATRDTRATPDPGMSREEIDDYMLPLRGGKKLQVFRCRECGVQIAHEKDACRLANADLGWYAATFKRTMNLKVLEGHSVCCLRCGVFLFAYDTRDDFVFTLPLFWDEARVFDKTPARNTIVIDMKFDGLVWEKDNQEADIEVLSFIEDKLDAQVADYDISMTLLVFMRASTSANNDDKEPFVDARAEYAALGYDLDRRLAMLRERGLRHVEFLFSFELDDKLAAMPTQDFALYINWSCTIWGWTDHPGYFQEDILMHMWLLCGGNMLLMDLNYDRVNPGLAGVDVDTYKELPDLWETPDESIWNRQPSLAMLMRDGHFVGEWYWTTLEKNPVPDAAFAMVQAGMQSRHLFPRWLFIRDFPAPQFDSLLRRYHAGGDINGADTVPFAARAKDWVVPRYRADPHKRSGPDPEPEPTPSCQSGSGCVVQ